jgi:hypothetical protein
LVLEDELDARLDTEIRGFDAVFPGMAIELLKRQDPANQNGDLT